VYELILLLAGLSLAATSVYLLVSTLLGNNTDANALAWASGNEPKKSKSGFINMSRPLVHSLTLQHAARVKSVSYRKKVEKKILIAGLSAELNVDEFIGLQILWGIMFPIMLVIFNFGINLGYPYWFCFVAGLAGFYFPHMHCKFNTQSRYLSVVNDLPFFVDLLALSTEAGLDFVGAIQRIVDKAENSVLGEELKTVLRDIQLGSARADALRGLASRLDIPEITSFVAVVNDADYTGASISQVLKDQAAQMRLERFVRAEKAGEQASQTIMVPVVIFIFPGILIVVFAPVILQFFYGGT
jgi:tight adherence protein C